jgi:hypothetical protein
VDKRHRRIRARSATGQVAGAATEKPGLNSPIVQIGLPSLRSPEGPSSQSTEPKPAPGHDTRLHRAVSCHEMQQRADRSTTALLVARSSTFAPTAGSADARRKGNSGPGVPRSRECRGASAADCRMHLQPPATSSLKRDPCGAPRPSCHHHARRRAARRGDPGRCARPPPRETARQSLSSAAASSDGRPRGRCVRTRARGSGSPRRRALRPRVD